VRVLVLNIHEYLIVNDEGKIQCRKCGHVFCEKSENYKLHIYMAEESPIQSGFRPNPEDFVYREFYCPSCMTLLEVEVARPGDPILWDIQLT
jgi:acetone carboxylase gamma subunit